MFPICLALLVYEKNKNVIHFYHFKIAILLVSSQIGSLIQLFTFITSNVEIFKNNKTVQL